YLILNQFQFRIHRSGRFYGLKDVNQIAGRCSYGIEPIYYLPYRHPPADDCEVTFAFLDLDAGLRHNLSRALAEGKRLGDGWFFRYLNREASMSHGNRGYPNMF